MHRLGQGASISRAARQNYLGGLRGRVRPKLVPYRGRFDGFHALPASVSKTCLVRFDNTKYSVSASAVGRPVEVHTYADRVVIIQDGCIVRGTSAVLRAWRDDLRSLALRAGPGSKTGRIAQRGAVQRLGVANGAGPRCGASLPGPTTATGRWSKLVLGLDPRILAAVPTDGLLAVEAACLQARLTHGKDRSARNDGRAEALRHEGRV